MTWWGRLDARRRGLALILVAAVLMAMGAWIASLMIESPREAALNAEPPEPSLITVPIERRQVGQEIVTRGLVTATQTVEAITSLSGAGALRAVVSGHVPRPGDEITAGGVVVEISGRPIIALQGDVPAYRDLVIGDSGPDVQRLNAALAGMGLGLKAETSIFDEATQQAVEAVYAKAGYASAGSLPAGEVVFISALPASIIQANTKVGTSVAEASVQIASGELTVSAQFSPGEAELVQDGAAVVLSSEILGESVDATAEVDTAGGIRISPAEPLGSAWAGQDVKVRVISAVTQGEVLAVPVAAIVANGSGETEVVVVRRGATSISDAEPRRVRVTVGAVGAGWAEVTPVDGAALAEGDPVQLSATTQG